MKKLLLIAVVVTGVSAVVLAGRAGRFGRRGYANGPGWMQPGPGGFGQRGFAGGPGWMRPGPGGWGPYGPLCNWQDDTTPPLMLGMLDLTDEQKETITKLVVESRAKLHADIEAVLTEEQIEKLEQLRENIPVGAGRGYFGIGPRRPFAGADGIPPALETLDLTDEQKAAIKEIRDKARTDTQTAETQQAIQEIMQAAHDEIKALLTDEQVEKLQQLQANTLRGPGRPGRGYFGIGPRGPFAGPVGMPPVLETLDLTEEQKTAIEKIRDKAQTDAAAAETRQARYEIMQAAREKILDLLTDEQKEQLQQLCPRMQWEQGGPGWGW
jgi:Spy/CpxP family protein refolding chaperone